MRRIASAAVVAAALTAASLGDARARGIVATGCDGCHGSAGEATLSASIEPAQFQPGDSVVVDIALRGDAMRSAGIFVTASGTGELRPLSGEGLALVSAGLTHSAPMPASAGTVHFRFSWTAPSAPGSVRFAAYAVSANGDGRNAGDAAGEADFDFVYGCAPQQYYYDGDGDGYGRSEIPPWLRCQGDALSGHAPRAGDCDDNRAETNPSATEFCNRKDDDCDGDIDENAELVPMWPDEDGDGYYRDRVGDPVLGCVPTAGYAAEHGDCAPQNPDVNPGAAEVCNRIDDDCDGRIDDRLRPQCGVGWCRRESATCSPDQCYPGDSEPEVCNGLDDDCDDQVDEDAACLAGEDCVAGECIASSGAAPSSDAGVAPVPAKSVSAPGRNAGCVVRRGVNGAPALLLILGLVLVVGIARRLGHVTHRR